MRHLRLIALLLALITLVEYLPVARDSFLSYDDGKYVTDNQVVQNGLTWIGIKWAFTTWRGGFWHPLTWLSHMLDCALFGLNSGAQHYVNVLFHAANAVLLLFLLFRLTDALWPSALAAALFAWHPLHVESVAWLSERKDVLSTFFEMLVLLAYVRYAQSAAGGRQRLVGMEKGASPSSPPPVPDHRTLYFWLAVIGFVLGLMAKPMLVTVPFVMLLLDYWPLGRIQNLSLSSRSFPTMARLTLEKWPFFLFSVVACFVASLAERHGGMTVGLQQVPLPLRLENALVSYVRYLGKTIWPVNLSIIYPLPRQLPWDQVTAATVFLMVVTWLAWRVRRRCPYLLVGWLWFLGTLVPVIGLVQLNFQSPGDHYTYVPLVGIFIAAAFGFRDLIARFQIRLIPSAVGASLILGSCLILTEHQLSFWRNDETLFSHAVVVTKNNAGAHVNLGNALAEQGYLAEALTQFQEAVRISPSNAVAHIFLGEALVNTGNTNEALAQSEEAKKVLKLNSQQPLLHYYLGVLLMQLGHFNEGMDQYDQAARLGPDNPSLYYEMSKLLLREARDAEAVDKLREALRLDPYNVPALGLLAETLATDGQAQIRDGTKAVTLAEKANTLTGGRQPAVLDILAMAYAETGRFGAAQQIEQRAIQLAQDSGLETHDLNQRLKLYRSGLPYHREPSAYAPTPAPPGK